MLRDIIIILIDPNACNDNYIFYFNFFKPIFLSFCIINPYFCYYFLKFLSKSLIHEVMCIIFIYFNFLKFNYFSKLKNLLNNLKELIFKI